ncbi:MAG: 4Fe-4S dicluster domain-containing protein [Bacillota bacterium]
MRTGSAPSLASAIVPLPNRSPVQHNWATLGLPEHGWVLIKDMQHCPDSCGGSQVCVDACIAHHALPVEGRRKMETCAQCDPAPCAEACPTEAIFRSAEGVLLVDQESCIGCRFCEDACASEALLFVDPYQTATPDYPLAHYSAGQPTGQLPYTVAKCTFCSDRLQSGQMPACAEACPGQAIWVGNLDRDTATNGRQLLRLSDLLARHSFAFTGPGNRVLTLH